jgi:outer membrane protein assembly factor BamB
MVYRTAGEVPLRADDLVFVGSGGRVAAMTRATGEIVWEHKVADAIVSVLCDPAVGLLVGASGRIWCLDPVTGVQRWHNELKGFGHGSVAIATTRAATRADDGTEAVVAAAVVATSA